MAKNKHPSPVREVSLRLKDQLRLGESKHEAKRAEETSAPEGIFSLQTYKNYVRHGSAFYRWAKKTYGCKSIDEARPYIKAYIEMRTAYRKPNGDPLSAWTLKLDAAAIAKLYKTSTKELGLKTPPRKRADITRSREKRTHDSHFSEEKNRDAVRFCKGYGLRRHELDAFRGNDIYQDEKGGTYVHVKSGKGGKACKVFVLPEYAEHIRRMAAQAGPEGKVFPKGTLKNRMDIHGYRASYAQNLYERLARPINTIGKKEQYHCRKDRSGTVYDRWAMFTVSENLGHTRVNVIAGHYLK